MNEKALYVVGGLAAVAGVVAIAATSGKSSSTGVSYAAADPQSVASVENTMAAEIASMNAASVAKTQVAANTILGLASAQQTILKAQMDNATQVQVTDLTTRAQTKQTQIQANAASHAVDALSAAQEAIAKINGGVTEAVASTNANAATTITDMQTRNATTQAQAAAGAQKTDGIFGAIGSIASGVLHFFSPASGGYQPTNSVSDLADMVPTPTLTPSIATSVPLVTG